MRIRKRIEEAFGWIKTVAGQDKTKFRGRDRVGWAFTFAAAAYNLVRLPKLMTETGFAKAFAGRWRIVEMDNWDNDVLDLVEEAHLTFQGTADSEIAFVALRGFLDVGYGARDGSACAEFSWEGQDESDPMGNSRLRRTTCRAILRPQRRRFRLRATDFFNGLLGDFVVVDAYMSSFFL